VHCKAGKGRSATVVLCYLMDKLQGEHLTPERAQELLLTRRSFVTCNLHKRATVHEFYRRRVASPPEIA
jgi:atypical dual specificity phosphatase